MNAAIKLPLYTKFALVMVGIIAFFITNYIAQQIIIPIVYSLLIAILLNPMVNFLIRKKVPKIIAITVAVVLLIFLCLLFFYIISYQISIFSNTFPLLKEKFNSLSIEFLTWFSEKFNIPKSKINTWITNTQTDFINNFAFQEKIMFAGQIMIAVMLIPVYVFMILFYKPLLIKFTHQAFKSTNNTTVTEIFTSTKKIIQSYLVGLFLELLIIATLNSLALLMLGIDYAIILGITGAIINVIPYIGGVIAIAMPMIIAFVTKDSLSSTVFVFLAYLLIQFVDNHFVIPKIVASRVKINPLISIIIVLIGNAIWGIPGMFISIPLAAILKVILDHIEPLKPYGFLMGELEIPKKEIRLVGALQKIIKPKK